MICSKCEYPQYRERVDTSQGMILVWRCIGCGNSVDEVILKNRTLKHRSRLGGSLAGRTHRPEGGIEGLKKIACVGRSPARQVKKMQPSLSR